MSAPARSRITADALVRLRRELSERDLSIIASLAECRYLSARQLQRWHFPIGDGADEHTPAGADRVTRRVMARHVRNRLALRLERRIGGVRAGSAGFVYGLGPIGQRILELPGARRRAYEPSVAFLDHTLAVAEIVVGLVEADRDKRIELLEVETEPHCWRPLPGSDGKLKPDLRVTLGTSDQELHWFVEVDLGTVHLPSILRKCHTYLDYYRSGREQQTAGVFPVVVWLSTQERVELIERAIASDTELPQRLFTVAPLSDALTRLRGNGGSR